MKTKNTNTKFDRKKEFEKDNEFGNWGEGVMINFIEEKFKNGTSFSSYWYSSGDITKDKRKLKKWDLRFGLYTYQDRINFYDKFEVEVKTDGYVRNTGNLIFEKSCNRKKSGVFATEAKYFIYFLPLFKEDNIYLIKSKDLIKLLNNYNHLLVEGGDFGSKTFMYKIPRVEFNSEFIKAGGKIITWNKYNIPDKFNKTQFIDNKYTFIAQEIKEYEDPFKWD